MIGVHTEPRTLIAWFCMGLWLLLSRVVQYSLEESGCCMRFFCKNGRAFTQTVWAGTKGIKGSVVLVVKKPVEVDRLNQGDHPCCLILLCLP
jgi:hypothetical protein